MWVRVEECACTCVHAPSSESASVCGSLWRRERFVQPRSNETRLRIYFWFVCLGNDSLRSHWRKKKKNTSRNEFFSLPSHNSPFQRASIFFLSFFWAKVKNQYWLKLCTGRSVGTLGPMSSCPLSFLWNNTRRKEEKKNIDHNNSHILLL